MKRFVFTLEAVLRYKLTVEKSQKAALAEVNARLTALNAELQQLLENLQRARTMQLHSLQTGRASAVELQAHALYFQRMRSDYASITKRIEITEAEREQREKELIATMRELKSYRKLRDEQYEEYMLEVRAEEEREIGEFVSYQSVKKS